MTYDEMARLHCACFGHLRPWSQAEFAELMASEHSFAITQPKGFLIGRALAGEAEIITLAVDPCAQRQGIGARLVQEFMRQSKQKGAVSAFLEVAANNTAAIALYRKHGFLHTGLRRAYYHPATGPAIDAAIMTRALR